MNTSSAVLHLSDETLRLLAAHAVSLTAEEQAHLETCTHCQSAAALSRALRRMALSENVPAMPTTPALDVESVASSLSPETLESLAQQITVPPVPPMPSLPVHPPPLVASQRPPRVRIGRSLEVLRGPALVLALLLGVWLLRPPQLPSPGTESTPELTPEPVAMLTTRGNDAKSLELNITGQIYRPSPAGLEKVLELSPVRAAAPCQRGDRLLLQLTGQGQGALEVWQVGSNSMRRVTRLPGVGLSPSERALSGRRLLLAGEASASESWPELSGQSERWVVIFGAIPTALEPREVLRLLADNGSPSVRVQALRCVGE